MTVNPVGTAVNTHAAAGSVTGTWGTGQFRVAGHLLVAVVTAGAVTSAAATANAGGWVNRLEVPNSGTANVRTAIWTLTATGGDAAPVFTSAVVGTGAMDCMLFEFSGGVTATPVDVSATYASGASPLTLSGSTMTATTAATAQSGEFSIACFAQEAAAGNLTWTDTGTNGYFQKVLNGNGVSSVLQTYVGICAYSAPAVTLNDSGAFSTSTSAFGAALVVAFAAAVNPENLSTVFTNNAAATVTAGGTTAPSGGTVEAWTVNASGAFPLASPAAQPPTQFTIADPLLPSEKFLVSVAPGGTGASQSWTVTRGAEGTTPVAHSPGFAVVEVTTAGFLTAAALQQSASAYVNCDYNGVIDASAAFNTALAALPVVNGYPVGIVRFGPGNVKMAVTPNNPGPGVYIQGAGWFATNVYSYVAAGDCFRVFNPNQTGPAPPGGGGIAGLTIWGDNATGAARGLHAGDLANYRVDIAVIDFFGTGAIGVWFDNEYAWTEEMEIDLLVSGCTQCVVFDNPATAAFGSGSSFDRLDARITIQQGLNGSNQVYGDGVVLQNGAFLGDGKLNIRGAFVMSSSATTAAVLRVIGSVPAGHLAAGRAAQITGCELQVGCEISGGFTNAPVSIYSDGTGLIRNCYGVLDFSLGGGLFVPSNITTYTTGSLLQNCSLVTQGDVALAQATDVEQYVQLNAGYTLTSSVSAQKLFNTTANGALTVSPGLYFFECEFDLTGLSASTGIFSFGFGGTATIGSCKYYAKAQKAYAAGALSTAGAAWQEQTVTTTAATALVSTSTTTTGAAILQGTFRVTSGGQGTVIPQITLGVLATPVVTAGSWFRCWQVANAFPATVTYGGAWT